MLGGGLWYNTDNGKGVIEGTEFRNNEATSHGGGLYIGKTGIAVLSNLTFQDNGAVKHGGGIYAIGQVSAFGVILQGNRAEQQGVCFVYISQAN